MTIVERRRKNIEIFADTMKLCETHPVLKKAIKSSVEEQGSYGENSPYWFDESLLVPRTEKAKVIVSSKRSFEAAEPYAKAGKNVCVLNFADWTNPGGWVKKGSSAQEESLCRCSTLYPCISDESQKGWYETHKAEKKRSPRHMLHNADSIVTPDVIVLKSDTSFPELLAEEEWYKVNVITCAAPRLRLKTADKKKLGIEDDILPIGSDELRELLRFRIDRILSDVVFSFGGSIDVLILGAFGCGAFRNPPELVAEVFNEVIKDYLYNFEVIEFPIFHTKADDKNYSAFLKHIEQN